MAALINDKCPLCQKRHTFYFAQADSFEAQTEYKFVCPQTRQRASKTFSQWNSVVSECPSEAVIVRANMH
jgi:hypothetical protein